MPDFSDLLDAPAGEAPRPPVLPQGTYRGFFKGQYSTHEAPPDKEYTKVIRFNIGLTEWPESISDDAKMQMGPKGPRPIDITKRQFRKEFYDNALWRLDEVLKSCGITTEGRKYRETLPELSGQELLVEVTQFMNQRTGELQNQIGNVKGTYVAA